MKTALIIGASRGLGFAIVKELLSRDWAVVGTVRQTGGTELHELAEKSSGKLRVEPVDITSASQIAELKMRLQDEKFDLLFVNAGIGNNYTDTISNVSADIFTKLMITNTLAPMKVVDAFQANVPAAGTIGIMSSGQGSLTNNEKGGGDFVYRASKAALNMMMRSFAASHASRTLLLIAPGWIKTDLGGQNATYTIEEAIPRIVDTIVAQAGKPGLQFLDQFGKPVPW